MWRSNGWATTFVARRDERPFQFVVRTVSGMSLPPPSYTSLAEVLHQLMSGDGEKQAASALGICRSTLHAHVAAIYRQFSVSSRSELMAYILKCVQNASRMHSVWSEVARAPLPFAKSMNLLRDSHGLLRLSEQDATTILTVLVDRDRPLDVRQSPRVQVCHAVCIVPTNDAAAPVPGCLWDIPAGGVGIISREPLRTGSRFTISMLECEKKLHFFCAVCYCRASGGGFRIGAMFESESTNTAILAVRSS